MSTQKKGRGLCLYSGGLDSQLAVCVLLEQGVEVEALSFSSPFFSNDNVKNSANALGVNIHVVDFTDSILGLLKCAKHGYGSCLNPCIDCHALMLRKAGEMMMQMGFDFVCTGEVLGQRPMSQHRQGLNMVQKDSGLGERLLRPLSALLLPETIPEREGLVDRSRLLDLNGRNRKPQIALAKKYGIKNYPTPAGGCKLTEPNYTRRLKNLKEHEGIDDIRLLKLLNFGRHFRLPNGTLVVAGRNKADNESIRAAMRGDDVVFRSVTVPGPTVIAIQPKSEADISIARDMCAAYADHKDISSIVIREFRPASKPVDVIVPMITNREIYVGMMI